MAVSADGLLKRLDRNLNKSQVGRMRHLQNLYSDQDQRITAMANMQPKDRQQPAKDIQKYEQDIEEELLDRKDYQAKARDLIRDLKNLNRTKPLSSAQMQRLQNLEQDYVRVDRQIANFETDFNQQKQDFRNKFHAHPPTKSMGMLRHAWDWTFEGLSFHESSRGAYFTISGQSKRNPYTGNKDPTDEQIRESILRLVKEQGVSTIYCYYGSDIDPQLTMRTKKILSDMMKPGHTLQGYNVAVSDTRMPDLEPWRWDNPFTRLSHKWDTWSENRAATKADKKAIRDEERSPIAQSLNPFPW